RLALPHAHWTGTVHHGLPRDLTRYYGNPNGGYLAFLGRISPEKGPERAIAIAKRVGMRLRIAAKVDRVDEAYFEREIRPLLDHPLIEWVGEIGEHQKPDFLGNAHALLFPVNWPEPFGLVIIEAMSCGTPTIAYRCGSVPEIIEDGVNGYVVDDEDGAAEALARVDALDREQVRACFERRYTAERMTDDYLRIYQRLKGSHDDRVRRAA
ncbi:MAG TPA: glycosyltransferase, partial [Burkholderiales bacterium]|nr:glycosyltransferase [Burkholderiales bacterium]